MTVKRHERRGSFKARAADGKEYTIIITVDILAAPTRGDPNGEDEGGMTLTTIDGYRVNWIEKGRYEVLTPAADVEVTTDDPSAP